MKRALRFLLVLGFSSISISAAWARVEFNPYLDASLFGGWSGYGGGGSTGFNGDIHVVPALRLRESLTIIPTLSYSYRRARDVRELVGFGGFLTQQSQDRGASLKGVYAFHPDWKAKAEISYSDLLVKETADESWSNGLFNHTRISEGLELERQGDFWRSLRFGLDRYQTNFSNFRSLASQQFGTEITAGGKTLDFNTLDFYAAGDLRWDRSTFSPLLRLSRRDFNDQHVVNRDGSFSPGKRQDLYSELSGSYRTQFIAPSLFQANMLDCRGGVDVNLSRLQSDQSSFDAARFQFNRNFYSYNEWSAGPALNVRFKSRWTGEASILYGYRYYADRPRQNKDGSYASNTISSRTQTFRWALGYELFDGVNALVRGSYSDTHSNTNFESLYRYNVSATSIFFGFTYQL